MAKRKSKHDAQSSARRTKIRRAATPPSMSIPDSSATASDQTDHPSTPIENLSKRDLCKKLKAMLEPRKGNPSLHEKLLDKQLHYPHPAHKVTIEATEQLQDFYRIAAVYDEAMSQLDTPAAGKQAHPATGSKHKRSTSSSEPAVTTSAEIATAVEPMGMMSLYREMCILRNAIKKFREEHRKSIGKVRARHFAALKRSNALLAQKHLDWLQLIDTASSD